MQRSISIAIVLCAVCAGFAQAQDDDFNPWKHLKVGDWAVYKSSPTPQMSTETKQVVTKVDGDKISYEIVTKMMMDGKPMGEPTKSAQTIDLGQKPQDGGEKGAKPKTSHETLKVKGKKLPCKVMETTSEAAGQKYVTKVWMSKKVPFGTVKVVSNGKVVSELVDWGRASGDDGDDDDGDDDDDDHKRGGDDDDDDEMGDDDHGDDDDDRGGDDDDDDD